MLHSAVCIHKWCTPEQLRRRMDFINTLFSSSHGRLPDLGTDFFTSIHKADSRNVNAINPTGWWMKPGTNTRLLFASAQLKPISHVLNIVPQILYHVILRLSCLLPHTDPAKTKLTYSAGQMIHFMNMSLFILEPFVPANAEQRFPFWKSWLLHRQLHVMMLGWAFTVSDVVRMDVLLQTQQNAFLNVFEYMDLWRPKQHVRFHCQAYKRKHSVPHRPGVRLIDRAACMTKKMTTHIMQLCQLAYHLHSNDVLSFRDVSFP